MHKINITTLQSSNVVSNGFRAYTQAYTCLQHIIQEHIKSRNALLLSESPKPIGRYRSIKMQGKALLDLVQENAEFVQMQDSQDHLWNVKGVLVTEQENPNLFKDLEDTDIVNS